MTELQTAQVVPFPSDEFAIVQDKPILPNRVIWGMAIALLCVVAYPASRLLKDSFTLQNDLNQAESNAVIGYLGIHPNLSFAHPPGPWLQRDGSKIKLWAGWIEGTGHSWFFVNQDEIKPERLSDPFGRDAFPSIDYPIVENGGGEIWQRIPDGAAIAGDRLGSVDTVYPILLLDKVVVVNDTIEGLPFLVTFNRFESKEKQVAVFDPTIDGNRITFGHSGYLLDKVPVLYDRGTDSLWSVKEGVLVSFSGSYKGRTLRAIAQPTPMRWSDWRYDHPESRLIVGSDRKKTRPRL